MSESIRIMDHAALTRALDEFRRIDPEQQAFGQRLAARAAADHLKELHKDVPRGEHASEIEVRDRNEGKGKQRQRDPERKETSQDAGPGDGPAPESNKGHLIDLKV